MFSAVPFIHLLANSCFIAAASFLVDNNIACGQTIPGRRTNRISFSLKSWNHWTVWVGRDIEAHPIPPSTGPGGHCQGSPAALGARASHTAGNPKGVSGHSITIHISPSSSKRGTWNSHWCKKVSEGKIWPQFKFQCQFRRNFCVNET